MDAAGFVGSVQGCPGWSCDFRAVLLAHRCCLLCGSPRENCLELGDVSRLLLFAWGPDCPGAGRSLALLLVCSCRFIFHELVS